MYGVFNIPITILRMTKKNISVMICGLILCSMFACLGNVSAAGVAHGIPLGDDMYVVQAGDVFLYKTTNTENDNGTVDEDILYTLMNVTRSEYNATEDQYYLTYKAATNTTADVNTKEIDGSQFGSSATHPYVITNETASLAYLDLLGFVYPQATDFRTFYTKDTADEFMWEFTISLSLVIATLMTLAFPETPIYTIEDPDGEIEYRTTRNHVIISYEVAYRSTAENITDADGVYSEFTFSMSIDITKGSNGVVNGLKINREYNIFQENRTSDAVLYDTTYKHDGIVQLVYPASTIWIWVVAIAGGIAILGIGVYLMRKRKNGLCPDGSPKVNGECPTIKK